MVHSPLYTILHVPVLVYNLIVVRKGESKQGALSVHQSNLTTDFDGVIRGFRLLRRKKREEEKGKSMPKRGDQVYPTKYSQKVIGKDLSQFAVFSSLLTAHSN